MKLVIPVTVIVVGMAALITIGVIRGGIPEVPVRELFAAEPSYLDRRIKVQGVIKEIRKDTRPLEFVISDREHPDRTILAVVDDVRPDVFKETNDVAVEGIYDPNTGKIHGTKIYTKCPSKYEASEQTDSGDGYAKDENAGNADPAATPAKQESP